MDKKRIFRALVCFVLICVFLINTSPIRIRVEATGLEPAAVAGTAVFFWFMLMMGGIVIEPTVEALNYIDQTAQINIGQEIAQLPADQVEDAHEQWQRSIADLMYWGENDFSNDDDSDDNDSSDPEIPEDPSTAEETKHSAYVDKYGNIVVGYALKGMIARWWYDIISSGVFEAYTGAEAPEGYAYYNGLLMPDCSSYNSYDFPYIVGFTNSNRHFICFSSKPLESQGSVILYGYPVGYELIYTVLEDSGEFASRYWYNSSNASDAQFRRNYEHLFFANYDLCDSGSSELILPAMEPTSHATIFIEPDMYFGDYPDQVENGTFDDESIKLPVFDFSSLLESSDSAYSDMQQVYDQVYNQQMSYNEFADQVQADNSIVNPDPGPGTDIVNPADPLPEPPPALGDYALDLRDFFPFCIPFDIYALLSLLAAEPEAPKFEFDLWIPYADYNWHIVIDLSKWDDVAAVLRTMELLLFIVGLGVATRNYYTRG